MSIYLHKRDSGKLIPLICECGSMDLERPRNSESDHRDVLRLSCKKCKVKPYWYKLDETDLIKITKSNKDIIFVEFCKQYNRDPNTYSWNDYVSNIIDRE